MIKRWVGPSTPNDAAFRGTATAITLIAVLVQGAPSTYAQAPQSRRIVTTTRLVARFSELEERLAAAIKRKDESALNNLLSDDFDQWTPAPPGDPIPREDWLSSVLAGFTLDSFSIRQMAVRSLDKFQLVSFVLSRKALCHGTDCSADAFIIDLWQEQAGGPRLVARYEALLPSPLQRSARLPPTPTGKE